MEGYLCLYSLSVTVLAGWRRGGRGSSEKFREADAHRASGTFWKRLWLRWRNSSVNTRAPKEPNHWANGPTASAAARPPACVPSSPDTWHPLNRTLYDIKGPIGHVHPAGSEITRLATHSAHLIPLPGAISIQSSIAPSLPEETSSAHVAQKKK